jgi:hypothetical protein
LRVCALDLCASTPKTTASSKTRMQLSD